MCCETQEATTGLGVGVGARVHFSIDNKACVTILEVPSWCSYGFGTTNKTPGTALMAKMETRHTQVEGRS